MIMFFKKEAPGIIANSYFRNQGKVQRSRDTCLMDFDKLSFYYGRITIWISWFGPSLCEPFFYVILMDK